MFPKYHIIAGAIFSFILYLVFPVAFNPVNALIVFLSSFLIDVDHYLYYVYKKKDWSLKKSVKWFVIRRKEYKLLSFKQKGKFLSPILIFHGIESIILLFLFSFYSKIFLFVLIGFLFHLVLDFIEISLFKGRIYPKTSWIYTFIRNKKRASLN